VYVTDIGIAASTWEEDVSAPFANIIGLLKTHRYTVLAATMLAAIALPLWAAAADNARARDGNIILAQAPPNETPEQRRQRELQQQKAKQAPPAPKAPPPAPAPQVKQPPQVNPPPQPKQPAQVNPPPQPKPPAQVNPPPGQNAQPKGQPKNAPVVVQPGGQPQGNPQAQQGNQPQQNPQAGPPGNPKGQPKGQPKNAPVVVQPGGQPQGNPQAQPGGQPPGNPQAGPPGNPKGQPKGQPKNAPVVVQPGGQPQGNPQAQPGGQPQGNPQAQPGGQPQGNPQVQPGGQPNPPGIGQPKQQPVVVQPPGQVPQGGPAVGGPPRLPGPANVDALRDQRRERREPGGRVIVEEPGGRIIVRDRGQVFIQHNDALRFSRFGAPVVERRGAETFNVVRRPDGSEVITVFDANGNMLRRMRRGPDGREVVLINNRPRFGPGAVGIGAAVVGAGLVLGLAAPRITLPRERYIVDVGSAPPALLVDTLMEPPVMEMERPYTLDEVRHNAPLRDRMPRIDIDTVTFATGSWEVTPDQYPALEGIARAILAVIARNPNEVFMIEGHTDAVGNPDDNLSLSDRRAESVALILSETYMIPPENLVTQGYGAQYLKIPTQDAERRNRRVSLRRITPLLGAAQ
jgi:outer membrane protein OmpA-like peptidoglycan-associated protein